jgi:hypothetical protein
LTRKFFTGEADAEHADRRKIEINGNENKENKKMKYQYEFEEQNENPGDHPMFGSYKPFSFDDTVLLCGTIASLLFPLTICFVYNSVFPLIVYVSTIAVGAVFGKLLDEYYRHEEVVVKDLFDEPDDNQIGIPETETGRTPFPGTPCGLPLGKFPGNFNTV